MAQSRVLSTFIAISPRADVESYLFGLISERLYAHTGLGSSLFRPFMPHMVGLVPARQHSRSPQHPLAGSRSGLSLRSLRWSQPLRAASLASLCRLPGKNRRAIESRSTS